MHDQLNKVAICEYKLQNVFDMKSGNGMANAQCFVCCMQATEKLIAFFMDGKSPGIAEVLIRGNILWWAL